MGELTYSATLLCGKLKSSNRRKGLLIYSSSLSTVTTDQTRRGKMKPKFFILVFFLITSGVAFAQASSPAEQEVLKAEQERIAAAISANIAKLEQLLSADLSYTHSNALVESKNDFLNSIKSGNIKYEAVNHKNVKVNLYGDTAVLRGQSDLKVQFKGQPVSLPIRFTAVYVKKDGRWQLTAWQSTRIQQ